MIFSIFENEQNFSGDLSDRRVVILKGKTTIPLEFTAPPLSIIPEQEIAKALRNFGFDVVSVNSESAGIFNRDFDIEIELNVLNIFTAAEARTSVFQTLLNWRVVNFIGVFSNSSPFQNTSLSVTFDGFKSDAQQPPGAGTELRESNPPPVKDEKDKDKDDEKSFLEKLAKDFGLKDAAQAGVITAVIVVGAIIFLKSD